MPHCELKMEKIKVIIVDDHTIVRTGLANLLNLEPDIECIAMAGDGEQGVRLVKELLPDVAIVDLAMPGLDGIEVARQIKDTCPSTKILIISAYKYNYHVLACMKVGVNGYLLKDTTPDELSNAIRVIHGGKSIFDLEITRKIQKSLSAKANDPHGGAVTLGERKLEILRLVAMGLGNREIGHLLSISSRTVGGHLAEIFGKLGVDTRTEAILYALREGMIDINDVSINRTEIESNTHGDQLKNPSGT